MKKSLKLILITLLFVFQSFADAKPIHPSYWHLPKDLYDQPMLNHPEFQSLSEEMQNQMLTHHFISRKRSALDLAVKTHLTALGAIPAIGTIIGALSVYYWTSIRNWQTQHPGRTLLAGAMLTPTSSLLIGSLIGHIVQTYQSLADRYWRRIEDPLESYELQYIVKKRLLTQAVQNQIEEQLKIARFYPDQFAPAVHFITTVLELPLQSKRATFNSEKITHLFDGYPPQLIEKVESFVVRQVMNQLVQQDETLHQPKQGKRVSAYFYGAPGSGKTRFAELIAKALDLPFARISLEGASISDLVGRGPKSGDPTPGLIAKAMSQIQSDGVKAKNMVLFIDEADRIINSTQPGSSDILPFMLKLLDPENKSFNNPFFNIDIDTSQLIIILAGNYQINDEALRKRLFLVNFDGFNADFKKKIVWESTLPKLFKSYSQNNERILSIDDLTAEDRDLINACIEADQDPGFRTLENVLMEFMDYKSIQKYFNPEIETPALVKMIQEAH